MLARLYFISTEQVPKRLTVMTPSLLFTYLNYSIGCHSGSVRVKLPLTTEFYNIERVPAGTCIFATVSVFNEVQESVKNPTAYTG